RLVDQDDRPPLGGEGGERQDVGGVPLATGTMTQQQRARTCGSPGAGLRRQHPHLRGPLGGGQILTREVLRRAAPHPPTTSPVVGSTTPTSCSVGSGSTRAGPLFRVDPTAGVTGQAWKRPDRRERASSERTSSGPVRAGSSHSAQASCSIAIGCR